jgi:lipopolysaccharide export LptBFGC system permease protein LptF
VVGPPELALLAAAIAALASRSFRVWKVGLGGAAVFVFVFLVVVLSTQLWAINHTPFVWPPFP